MQAFKQPICPDILVSNRPSRVSDSYQSRSRPRSLQKNCHESTIYPSTGKIACHHRRASPPTAMHRNPRWLPVPTRSFKQQSLSCKYRAGLISILQSSHLPKRFVETPVVCRVSGSNLPSENHPEAWDTEPPTTADVFSRQTRL